MAQQYNKNIVKPMVGSLCLTPVALYIGFKLDQLMAQQNYAFNEHESVYANRSFLMDEGNESFLTQAATTKLNGLAGNELLILSRGVDTLKINPQVLLKELSNEDINLSTVDHIRLSSDEFETDENDSFNEPAIQLAQLDVNLIDIDNYPGLSTAVSEDPPPEEDAPSDAAGFNPTTWWIIGGASALAIGGGVALIAGGSFDDGSGGGVTDTDTDTDGDGTEDGLLDSEVDTVVNTTYMLNGTDLTNDGLYTVAQINEMYGSTTQFAETDVHITFILNRSAVIDNQNYKTIDELLEMNYSDQQNYINKHASDIPGWYGASQTDMETFKTFIKKNNFTIYNNSDSLEQRSITIQGTADDFAKTFLSHCSTSQMSSSIYSCDDGDAHLSVTDQSIQKIIMGSPDLWTEVPTTGSRSETLPVIKAGISTNEKVILTAAESAATSPRVLYPTEIASMYNFPMMLSDNTTPNYGAGNTIGIVALYNDETTFAPTLDGFVNAQHPRLNYNAEAQVDTLGSAILTGEAIGEFDLDISIISSIVPAANIKLLGSNENNPLVYASYALGVYHEDINIISSSYSMPAAFNYQADIFEALYQDAMLRDITVVVASGDRGSANAKYLENFTGQPLPLVTSGAPTMLSVGGSSFSKDITEGISRYASSIEAYPTNYPALLDENQTPQITVDDQTTWNELKTYTVDQLKLTAYTINLASNEDPVYNYTESFNATDSQDMKYYSGLLSNTLTSSGQFDPKIYAIPRYQQNNLPEVFTQEDGAIYPHVSFLAGGNTAHGGDTLYLIASNNGLTFSGGTSASAPLMASLVALTNSALTNSALNNSDNNNFDGHLGFINPLLYEIYASTNKDVFIDIPLGSNNASVTTVISPEDFSTWDKKNALLYSIDNFTHTITILPITGIDDKFYKTDVGFDMATGLGSINGQAFFKYIDDADLF